MPCGDEAVAAVFSWSAQHGYRPHRPSCPDRHRDRTASRLHEAEAINAARLGRSVGFTHLGGCQQSDFVVVASLVDVHVAEPQLADNCCFQFLRRGGFRFVIVRLGADEVEDHAARHLTVLEAIENIVDRG